MTAARCFAVIGVMSLSLLLGACGSSSAPTDGGGGGGLDGGPTVDGGPALDGGAEDGGPVADGGAGCPFDGGCPTSGCQDLSGTYTTCVDCGAVGKFGPLTTDISQVCGCQLSACVDLNSTDGGAAAADGGTSCGAGCVDTNGQVQVILSVVGLMISCSGQLVDGGADFTCPVPPIATCTASFRQGVTSCP